MNRELMKILLVAGVMLTTLLACAYIGWALRGLKCSADLSSFQSSLAQQAQEQRQASAAIEVKQEATTKQSTERLDQQQSEQQKEIVYVEKKVVQYRDRWRDRDCERPADWVQLYNESLFGSDPAMPEASPAGSAPDGSTVLLPAGRD